MITKRKLLKERLDMILYMALDKDTDLYKTSTQHPDWDLVRSDMVKIIDAVFGSPFPN